MRSIAVFLAREVIIWYTLPVLFLAFYVGNYQNSTRIIVDHLYAITLFALTAFLLSIFIQRVFKRETIALILSSVIYGSSIFFLAAYYTLVLIGLKSWGRVISEELIVSYAEQSQQLCEAIGIPFSLLLLVLITLYLLVVFAFFVVLKKFTAPAYRATSGISPTIINIMLLSLVIFGGFQLHDYFLVSDVNSKEPFNLTLFSGKTHFSKQIDSNKLQFNNDLEQLETIARSKYRLASNANRKNVILIVVDALRPDHMGVYGYPRNTTPYLSDLASKGVLTTIDNVHASCGASACGLSSIASSKYIHQLPSNPFSLQQVLQRYGYTIHMILGGDHTNFYNIKELYGKVDSYYDGASARRRFYINDDALVIDKTSTLPQWNGTPTMFQFHLMSAHILGKHQPRFEIFQPHKNYAVTTVGGPKEEYTNHYDNGVLQTDSVIQELLELLQTKNYLKNSLVIITADHGEGLGEHKLFSHANSVRQELLRIPLVLIDFSKSTKLNRNNHQFYSQVDIAPTILNSLHMPIPENWYGYPVQFSRPSSKKLDFTFFQLNSYIGLFDHRNNGKIWKYWRDTNTDEEFAFDIAKDPAEHDNLVWKIPVHIKDEWRRITNTTQAQYQ